MEGVFLEFENENALRRYPFAAGCVPEDNEDAWIPDGVFVDAAIYPVNPSGTIYLSSISEDGTFSISDSEGVIMKGSASGNTVELFDTSSLSRHVGTLVASSAEALSEFAGRGMLREYTSSQTAFAASCVFPVVVDGVTMLRVGDNDPIAGRVVFQNGQSDAIRVSSGRTPDGRKTLRFDVLPKPVVEDDMSIRRIICVVDGQTPFRIKKMDDGSSDVDPAIYNSVILSLAGIDRENVCAAAHRDNSFEMADTCCCAEDDGSSDPCSEKTPCPKVASSQEPLPETYIFLEVFIPPDSNPEVNKGLADGADNAFYLVVPNLLGGVNPLSITLEDGKVSPKTEDLEVTVRGNTTQIEQSEFLDSVTSKGVVLQVPGLSGGMI